MTEILEVMRNHFGELDVSRGDENELLGMRTKINRMQKNVIIDMWEQIQEAFDMLGEELDKTVASPANKNLFTTYDGLCDELDDNKIKVFH